MSSMFEDVAEFQKKILGINPIPSPTLVSLEFSLERFRHLQEELTEYLDAAADGDMVKTVDGLLDLVYIALGTLHQMGLTNVTVQECWYHIHRSNMMKVRGATRRGKADAVKPIGWFGPEPGIASAIYNQMPTAFDSTSDVGHRGPPGHKGNV